MTGRQILDVSRAAAAVAALAGPAKARRPAGLAFAFLWLFPTLSRNCRWHGPLLRSLTGFPGVWLTFDDGPDPRCTPAFLEILEHFGAKASFFAIGSRVRALPSLARRIVAKGHTLENHTLTHPASTWWLAGPRRTVLEIQQATRAIAEATGFSPRFFRAPVGMVNPWVHARLGGLEAVGWTAAGGDACPNAPGRVASRLLSAARPGAILLMHEGSGVRHRARALELVLEGLRQAGLPCLVPERGRQGPR
ncbi:MAG: polysaccharide deacetylase family protein [Terrimicrobiaceae bacterium]|nr:polysaccharide deacetylase family protein [Terrimicrobiaceae bacterium]